MQDKNYKQFPLELAISYPDKTCNLLGVFAMYAAFNSANTQAQAAIFRPLYGEALVISNGEMEEGFE